MFKQKFFAVLLFLGVLALVTVACAETAVETDGLEDTKWILESYGEPGNLQAVIEGSQASALFDSAEGRVTGSASCNSYFGEYQLNKNELSVPLLANTEMYCMEPEGIMDQEQEYLKALSTAESYKVEDGKLQIDCGDQILVFVAE